MDNADSEVRGISRRDMLGLGVASLISLSLAACGGGQAQPIDAQKLVLPDALGYKPVPGEHLSKLNAVPPAFNKYPAAYRTVSRAPGRGGSISTLQINFGAPAPSNNAWLGRLGGALGVELKQSLLPATSYGQKVAAVVASGDIPDLTFIEPIYNAPSLLKIITEGAFTDLAPLLASDDIKQYENLGRFPTYAWKNVSLEGGIYGVPHPTPIVNTGTGVYRVDWAEKLGLDGPPRNADEVYKMFVGFAKGDPDGDGHNNTWASVYTELQFVEQMFRVPNKWRLQADGTLVNMIETHEYAAALEFDHRLYGAGAFRPGAVDNRKANIPDAATAWENSTVGVRTGSTVYMYGKFPGGRLSIRNPHARTAPLIPPGHDGGKPLIYQDTGYFGYFGIPSSVGKDKARIHELLGVLDYLAAPFGSKEYTLVNYGIEGRNFTYDSNGAPVLSSDPKLSAEVISCNYFPSPVEIAFFYPGVAGEATLAQSTEEAAYRESGADPTIGYYSPTAISSAGALAQLAADYEDGMVTGRRPLSALKEYVSRWKAAGGDKIRDEYERAMHKK